MNSLRLSICCYLCAFTYNVWAFAPQSDGNLEADHSDLAGHKQEKMAGRANYVNSAGGVAAKDANARYPVYTQEAREKKPLSKEEKQAIRRQINENEVKYPKKN